MSKRLEYKVVRATLEELESTLNIYAQDGFRAVHFFDPSEEGGEVPFILSRKQKSKKKHHEVFEEEESAPQRLH